VTGERGGGLKYGARAGGKKCMGVDQPGQALGVVTKNYGGTKQPCVVQPGNRTPEKKRRYLVREGKIRWTPCKRPLGYN